MIVMEKAEIESEIDYTYLQQYFNEISATFIKKADEILKVYRLEHLKKKV